MPLNDWMRRALKAFSYPDLDMKRHYKLARKVANVKSYRILKPLYKTWDHRVSGGDHDIPVRLFYPAKWEKKGILIFFHGGGWVIGNIDTYTRVCANMADITRRLVVSVDYRLAPEYKFPAAPEDCYRVVQEIFSDETLFGITLDNIVLIGDSAGANLAAAVSLMARDRGEFMPKKQILLYPATYFDHSPASPFPSVVENGTDFLLTSKRVCDYMDLYRQSTWDDENPYFAPLVAQSCRSQPATLLLTAEYDPLRDEGEAYGEKLRADGNRVVIHRVLGALHGFFSLPAVFSQVGECYQWINAFLDETPLPDGEKTKGTATQ